MPLAREASCSQMKRWVSDQPGPRYCLVQSGALERVLCRMQWHSSICSSPDWGRASPTDSCPQSRHAPRRKMPRPRAIASAPLAMPLPLLAKGTDFHLERPRALRLLVKLPIGARDRCGRHQQIRVVERVCTKSLETTLPHPFGVNTGIDDEMRDVDILRPQFARHCLRDSAQAKFSASERRKAGAATERGGRTGEEDVARPARNHQPSRLAAGEEAGIARHLPHLTEHALGGIEDRKIDVGADVEDADFHRCVLVGVVEERDDLLFLARIERACLDLAADRLDLLD